MATFLPNCFTALCFRLPIRLTGWEAETGSEVSKKAAVVEIAEVVAVSVAAVKEINHDTVKPCIIS
jgi:hypothetical protein